MKVYCRKCRWFGGNWCFLLYHSPLVSYPNCQHPSNIKIKNEYTDPSQYIIKDYMILNNMGNCKNYEKKKSWWKFW